MVVAYGVGQQPAGAEKAKSKAMVNSCGTFGGEGALLDGPGLLDSDESQGTQRDPVALPVTEFAKVGLVLHIWHPEAGFVFFLLQVLLLLEQGVLGALWASGAALGLECGEGVVFATKVLCNGIVHFGLAQRPQGFRDAFLQG